MSDDDREMLRRTLNNQTRLLEEIERLRAENHHLRGLLETAVDAWDCGRSVIDRHCKLLVDFRGACLPKAWRDEAAKKAAGEQ